MAKPTETDKILIELSNRKYLIGEYSMPPENEVFNSLKICANPAIYKRCEGCKYIEQRGYPHRCRVLLTEELLPLVEQQQAKIERLESTLSSCKSILEEDSIKIKERDKKIQEQQQEIEALKAKYAAIYKEQQDKRDAEYRKIWERDHVDGYDG